ncbi:MAG: hypothetical protein J4472_02490 [DPANN group archaeon]|nr:hypothetical protein [DPANN group archaeon]MBS3078798.1 hypothetical protein [Candidatus Pacearchaeota archaeon]
MKREDRFDPHHENYAFLAINAAIEIDNSRRDDWSRLDHVREFGELLEKAVAEAQNNPDLGFYTIIEFRNTFQQPLREYGYAVAEHTQVDALREDLIRGLSIAADELKRFAYMPREMQAKTDGLMIFCTSLSSKFSSIRDTGRRYLAA